MLEEKIWLIIDFCFSNYSTHCTEEHCHSMLYLHYTLELSLPRVCTQRSSCRWHEHSAVYLESHSLFQHYHDWEYRAHCTEFLKIFNFVMPSFVSKFNIFLLQPYVTDCCSFFLHFGYVLFELTTFLIGQLDFVPSAYQCRLDCFQTSLLRLYTDGCYFRSVQIPYHSCTSPPS